MDIKSPYIKIVSLFIITTFILTTNVYSSSLDTLRLPVDNSERVKTAIERIDETLPIDILAQRITTKKGAMTGEVHIDDVIGEGASGIIAGHSEPRGNFQRESNAKINQQIRAGHDKKLKTVILCVGESGKEKSDNKSQKVVRSQLLLGLKGLTLEQVANTIIAYEPRWAIKGSGYGKPAEPKDAQEMALYIRNLIKDKFDEEVARKVRIMYGGSADKTNARDYLSKPDVDGLLVGGKSTSVEEFLPIIKIAEEIGPTQGRKPYIGGNWKTYEIKDTNRAFIDAFGDINLGRVEIGIAPSLTKIGELVKDMTLDYVILEFIAARTVHDSRGNATIQMEVILRNKKGQTFKGLATVPAGASTGVREVDINPDFVTTSREVVIPALEKAIEAGEVDITSQKSLADWLKKLDGTVRLEEVGGNVILAACWAFADAVAQSRGIPLHQYWTDEYGQDQAVYSPEATYNILNAGAHGSATTKVDTQETQFVFLRELNAVEQNKLGVAVNKAMKKYLKAKSLATTNGDEGGYSPAANSNMEYIEYLIEAVNSIENGPKWGEDIMIAFDFASSEFFKDGYYYLQGESQPIDLLKELGDAGKSYFRGLVTGKQLNSTTIGVRVKGVQHNSEWLDNEEGIRLTEREWLAYVQYMLLRVPVWSAEDICAENDWASMREMTRLLEEDRDFYDARCNEHQSTKFYDGRRVWHLGDDSVTSNPDYILLTLEGSENTDFFERIDNETIRSKRTGTEINLKALGAENLGGKYVVRPHTLNAFLLKFNQIGTPDDTFMAAGESLKRGALTSFSHRSGSAGDWHFIHGAYVAAGFKHNESTNTKLLPELREIKPRVNIKAGNVTRERMLFYHNPRESIERGIGLIESDMIAVSPAVKVLNSRL